MDDLCSEDGRRAYEKKILLCGVTVAKRSFFVIYNFLFGQMMTPNCLWSVGCQIVSVGVFDRCFWKVETRACETLRSCAKRFGDLRPWVDRWGETAERVHPAGPPGLRHAALCERHGRVGTAGWGRSNDSEKPRGWWTRPNRVRLSCDEWTRGIGVGVYVSNDAAWGKGRVPTWCSWEGVHPIKEWIT